jgi:hypothetical protein
VLALTATDVGDVPRPAGSVSRLKHRDPPPPAGKKIFDLLKVFQNDPYFICMYATGNHLERIGGCVRPMLRPFNCSYQTHPDVHAHRLCLRRRSGGRYAVVDSKPVPSGMATVPLPREHYFF